MPEIDGKDLREELVAVLARSPLLRLLGQGGGFAGELRKLLDEAHFVAFEAGQVVLREGASCDGIFILVQGKLEVLKERKAVGEIGQPGEVFGELGMLGDGHRTATVRAVTDAKCLKTGAGLHRRLNARENVLFAQAMQHALAQIMLARMNTVNSEVVALRADARRRDREIEELKQKNSHLKERVEGLVKERDEGFRGRRK